MQFADMNHMKTVFETVLEPEAPASEDLIATAKQYIKLKGECKELDAKLKSMKEAAAEMEENLFLSLENQDIHSMAISDKIIFRKVDMYASIDKELESNVFKWLEDEAYEALIKLTVNTRSLTAAIKSFIEEGGDTDDITSGIKLRTKNSVGVRKR